MIRIVVLAKNELDAKNIESVNRQFADKYATDYVSVTVMNQEEAPE